MAGSFLYCVVIQYYYGYGDSLVFYEGSNFIRKVVAITGNPFKPFFMSGVDFTKLPGLAVDTEMNLPTGIAIESNVTIMKIAALLSYLSFKSYLIISLFFGLFSFIGLWKLFCVFNEITEKKVERPLAIAILYTPSIWFWGSGLIKDSICIGALSLATYFIYNIFIKKQYRLKDVLLLLLMLFLLFIIKTYLVIALLVAIVLAYAINLISKSRKNILKLFFVSAILFVSAIIVLVSLSSSLSSIIEDSKSNIETFRGAYASAENEDERSMASFTGTTIGTSVPDIISASPVAIFTTLYRPFVWETRKPIMLFSALESLVLLIATIYVLFKCRLFKFFYFIFANPYLFFCFIFSIILGIIIGFSTFNFGTLVRYRLPILPYYFFMLLYIYVKSNEAAAKKSLL